MNSIYFLIFFDSLKAQFLLALSSESAWFAALGFGGYNMNLATLAALVGSVIGMSINFAFGYYMSRWRTKLPVYNEGLYNRLSGYFNRFLFILMAVPPLYILEVMPGVAIYTLVCGMFRVSPAKGLAMIGLSRVLYYAYYLTQPAQIL